MADRDPFSGSDLGRALGAVLFSQAVIYTLDTWGTLHSSPWTAETFGTDPRKAAAVRKYMVKAVVVSSGIGIVSAWAARSAWPVVGVLGMNAYLWHTYTAAIATAQDSSGEPTGSWDNPSGY